jgi:hypothetical protein
MLRTATAPHESTAPLPHYKFRLTVALKLIATAGRQHKVGANRPDNVMTSL